MIYQYIMVLEAASWTDFPALLLTVDCILTVKHTIYRDMLRALEAE